MIAPFYAVVPLQFLEVAGEKWQGGAFHRPAGHVLQVLLDIIVKFRVGYVP